ncbi:SDR family NAD(P)-dependent oxidoreductase [Amycolatopsis sp. lyj-23]|uniref:SDR family NAD(P)-dependent oxidoreductase n=1 Tax=Amycolatopsis sp. lyj-23 TaxID=2789283 RepID=UPI00397D05D5
MTGSGRVAVITGGARGLGRELSEAFAAAGYRVAAAGRDESAAEGLDRSRIGFHKADVTDAGSVRALFDEVAELHGRVDVLVANAGISVPGPVATAPAGDWAAVVHTNVVGTFHSVQAAVPHLERTGGRILTLSSALATRVTPFASAYSASKAAIETLTRTAAVELAPRGITVNCLAPGIIDAGMGRSLAANEAVWPRYAKRLAMGRPGRGAEVAAAALFLAGPDAGYVNGHVLEVNGGLDW